jgi:hypothetical protein
MIVKRKNLFIILIILAVDIFGIGLWVYCLRPDASASIALTMLVPVIFIVNIIIAAIAYRIQKHYTLFFIVNAFVSCWMMYFAFTKYIELNNRASYEEWNFIVKSKSYTIYYQLNDPIYFVDVNCGEGCSYSYDRGTVLQKNDTLYFTSVNKSRYYIYNGYMCNFKNVSKIKVKKQY